MTADEYRAAALQQAHDAVYVGWFLVGVILGALLVGLLLWELLR